MKCPYCDKKMKRIYEFQRYTLNDNPDCQFFRIKKQDDLELSKGFDGIPHCEAYHYSSCKKIVIDYGNK